MLGCHCREVGLDRVMIEELEIENRGRRAEAEVTNSDLI